MLATARRLVQLVLVTVLSVAPGLGVVRGTTGGGVGATTTYDARPNSSETTLANALTVAAFGSTQPPPSASEANLSAGLLVFVAADTAATGGRSVDEVLNSLPKGKQSFVRTVPDEQTLQSTFGDLTRGGTPTTWKGYNGQVFELQDGTQIGMRGTSSSGGSTIDIRIPGQDPFKIHIG